MNYVEVTIAILGMIVTFLITRYFYKKGERSNKEIKKGVISTNHTTTKINRKFNFIIGILLALVSGLLIRMRLKK